jgi:hypothetical protein
VEGLRACAEHVARVTYGQWNGRSHTPDVPEYTPDDSYYEEIQDYSYAPEPEAAPKRLRFAEHSLWSTWLGRAGECLARSTYRVFTCARGQAGQGSSGSGLSIAETNVCEGGRAGYGDYSVSALHYEIRGGANDVEAVRHHGCIAWDFTQTQIDIGHFGLGMASGLFNFSQPVRLAANQQFAVLLRFGNDAPPLCADLSIRVTLCGLMETPS